MTLYKQLQKYKDRAMSQNNQLQKTMNATIIIMATNNRTKAINSREPLSYFIAIK